MNTNNLNTNNSNLNDLQQKSNIFPCSKNNNTEDPTLPKGSLLDKKQMNEDVDSITMPKFNKEVKTNLAVSLYSSDQNFRNSNISQNDIIIQENLNEEKVKNIFKIRNIQRM